MSDIWYRNKIDFFQGYMALITEEEQSVKMLTWTAESYCVLTYQYSVTVNDSVEPVSNGEDCTLLKLVPDSLLDEAVSSKGARNTTPEHKNL